MTDSLSIIHHLIDNTAQAPSDQATPIYRNLNGDSWELIQDPPNGRMLVRHTSGASAGGAASEMSVEEFLAVNASGPEHGALRLLLGR